MNLKIKERLQLAQILPTNGNMVEMILARSLNTRINLDAEEINEFEVKQDGNIITWNQEKDNGKEFIFNESEIRLLKESVTKADESKLITMHNLDVCLKVKDA